jgi:hypothetical protein
MRRHDPACDEQAQADAVPAASLPPRAKGSKTDGITVRRNWRAAVVDNENHVVALLVRCQVDRRSAAVLDRVTDEIRHDLGNVCSGR